MKQRFTKINSKNINKFGEWMFTDKYTGDVDYLETVRYEGKLSEGMRIAQEHFNTKKVYVLGQKKMRNIKELAEIAGIAEKKLDDKLLLQLKKKLLTIIKKQGLLKASEFIKQSGKKHGDEYIDPLIAYVKFTESQIDNMENHIMTEEDLQEAKIKLSSNRDPYEMRNLLAKNLVDMANDVQKFRPNNSDPDSDQYDKMKATKNWLELKTMLGMVGQIAVKLNKLKKF